MEAAEDDELQLLRISEGLVADLQKLLRRVLWRKSKSGKTEELKVHQIVKQQDLDHLIILKIEPFQQEPQLLDVQLKNVIPQLVTAYLQSRGNHHDTTIQPGHVTVQYAICKILYTFCKVRGEKVIVGFFNNEPRYLEPLLSDFERGSIEPSNDTDTSSPNSLSWEGRYILLLWLSHLMLSPFDLATMSSIDVGQRTTVRQLQLPQDTPGIALRVIPICLKYLETATRERNAASQLLVRLCLRPDMRKIGLLDAVAKWAIESFKESAGDVEIHKSLGVLAFISGLVASGNQREIGHFIAPIFAATQRLATDENDSTIKSSAVARKLFVKIFRNIVTLCLQAPPDGIDTTSIIEDVIGILLDTLADGDTPVRFAASKALSIVTLKLDSGMAEEIVEAILGFLYEDVLWEGSQRNLNAVNPLKWHGLILTLSHLLYRRAVSTEQLPPVLNALLLGLTFEQRSTTGASIGTNVRDAANFGIWAIARRYTTKELQTVDLVKIRVLQNSKHKVSITQMLAIELIQSACLDPAGNIRRGSSAVLQELVGRHPDTIVEGIALIQVVDFHAVGLRQRAITEVSLSAAKLSPMYWDALFDALLDWRGIGAVDAGSRVAVARAIGSLSSMQPFQRVEEMIKTIRTELKQLASRQVEERHGLMMCLASIITSEEQRSHITEDANNTKPALGDRSHEEMDRLTDLWNVFETDVSLSEKDFTSAFLRPELTASATLRLIHALSTLGQSSQLSAARKAKIIELFNFCLGRGEETVLEQIPSAVIAFSPLVVAKELRSMVDHWLSFSTRGLRVGNSRSAGRVLALGAVFRIWVQQNEDPSCILDVLTGNCTTDADIDERVVALRSLKLVIADMGKTQHSRHLQPLVYAADQKHLLQIANAVNTALNDYTINERGDVGSLVRLEAIDLVDQAWMSNVHFQWDENDESQSEDERLLARVLEWKIGAAMGRLSLERLDKVRAKAARCAYGTGSSGPGLHRIEPNPEKPDLIASTDFSSYNYFFSVLQILSFRRRGENAEVANLPALDGMTQALFEGYTSSAGMGSETVIQVSRSALYDFLDTLPLDLGLKDDALCFTLLKACNVFSNLLKDSLSSDRVVLPLLEVIAFLLDVGIMQRLSSEQFKWRTFLSLIQKSHFKSNNMQKLHTVLNVYRGLAEIPSIRKDVLTKVSSMLLHPFPSIRLKAAETLFLVGNVQELKPVDWSQSTKVLKEHVDRMRQEGIV